MAWHSYPYLPQFRRVGSVAYSYRPSLRVEVSSQKNTRAFIALVDSGTDITMMDAQIASMLDIQPDGRPTGTASSLGGDKKGFLGEVHIKVPEFEETITCSVLFIEGLTFDIILGQDDFFRRFFVKFEKNKNTFYLDIAR